MSNSTCSLLLYRDAIDCILTFHPAVCYNCLLVPGGFFLSFFLSLFLSFFLIWQFFRIFYIDNHVLCEQRQFYFSLPSMYAFYFLFWSHCISQQSQYNFEKEWREETSLLCSRSQQESSKFLTMMYDVSCRCLQILFINFRKSPLFLVFFLRQQSFFLFKIY